MLGRMFRRQKKVLAGFGYVLLIFLMAIFVTAMLWEYRVVANEVIWMFLGVFSVMSIFFGLFFYLVFGRTAPDVQM